VANAFPELDFNCICERDLQINLPDDGLPFRNSINPIPYDEQHLLHIVHKVFPTKRYVFWAVLIDKRTLQPTMITARPLLSARSSASASMIYASSATCLGDELVVFAGIDDCGIGAWRISKTELPQHWVSIA
jgi:hypothetical protein